MKIPRKPRSPLKHYSARNLQQAENRYKEILQIQPDNLDASNFLGIIFQQKKDYDSAIISADHEISYNDYR
jgi:tetratricopeptide (TPR) repeat protein